MGNLLLRNRIMDLINKDKFNIKKNKSTTIIEEINIKYCTYIDYDNMVITNKLDYYKNICVKDVFIKTMTPELRKIRKKILNQLPLECFDCFVKEQTEHKIINFPDVIDKNTKLKIYPKIILNNSTCQITTDWYVLS